MGVQRTRSESEGNGDHLDLEVPPDPRWLTEVRQAVEELPLPRSRLDVAKLLVNELVANSIRHAGLHPGERIRITAEVVRDSLRVDVLDGGTPAASAIVGAIRPPPEASSGWGLYLVETFATRWGRAPGRYWFELDLDVPADPER